MKSLFPIVGLVLGLALTEMRPNWMDLETHWTLTALMILCLLPAFRWATGKTRPVIPFAPTVGVFYFFWFGYAAYSDADLYATVSVSDLSTETVFLVLVAVVTLAFGWRLALLGQIPEKTAQYINDAHASETTLAPKLTQVYSIEKFGVILLAVLTLLHLSGTVNNLPGSIQQLLIYVETFASALAAYSLANRSRDAWFLIAAGLISVDLILALNTGSLYHVITRVMLIGIVLSSVRKSLKPLILMVLVGSAVFISLQTVKFYFRGEVWRSDLGSEQMSEMSKLKIWQEGIERRFSDDDLSGDDLLESASARAAAISLFEHARRFAPDVVPFREGETLVGGLVGIIPRALWPDKPISSFGNTFGREFEIISWTNETTAINVPWIVDWYWNFGDSGVIFGMLLTGLLLGLIDRNYNGVYLAPFDLAVGLSLIWPRLVIHESNWAMSFGGLPLMILFYAVFRRVHDKLSTNTNAEEPRVTLPTSRSLSVIGK